MLINHTLTVLTLISKLDRTIFKWYGLLGVQSPQELSY